MNLEPQTPLLVYFSSRSQNTHRFIKKLGLRALRIPDKESETKLSSLILDEPYVLVVPTFAGHDGSGAVPKPVIHFLNHPDNRAWLRGVIASGNRNFGTFFGYAGDVIAARCKVPYLYRFELAGTEEDVVNVKNGVEQLWKSWTQNLERKAL